MILCKPGHVSCVPRRLAGTTDYIFLGIVFPPEAEVQGCSIFNQKGYGYCQDITFPLISFFSLRSINYDSIRGTNETRAYLRMGFSTL
jgi:hypothetical protein